MWSDYIDKHGEANGGADDAVPLYRKILVFTGKQWDEFGQLDFTDLSIDQENDQTSVDELNQKHLYDT